MNSLDLYIDFESGSKFHLSSVRIRIVINRYESESLGDNLLDLNAATNSCIEREIFTIHI